jgi:hypothetical protein
MLDAEPFRFSLAISAFSFWCSQAVGNLGLLAASPFFLSRATCHVYS